MSYLPILRFLDNNQTEGISAADQDVQLHAVLSDLRKDPLYTIYYIFITRFSVNFVLDCNLKIFKI